MRREEITIIKVVMIMMNIGRVEGMRTAMCLNEEAMKEDRHPHPTDQREEIDSEILKGMMKVDSEIKLGIHMISIKEVDLHPIVTLDQRREREINRLLN